MGSQIMITTLIVLATGVALAAGDAHGGADHGGIPSIVYYQIFNVSILLGGIFYLTKDKVVAFFAGKKSEYLKSQEAAEQALKAAELEHSDIQTKLAKIENTHAETIAKAKADAEQIKKQIVTDAEALAARLRAEAEMSAKLEVQRVKTELREKLLAQAFDQAQKEIASKTTAADQKRLQQDFISKVEVVR